MTQRTNLDFKNLPDTTISIQAMNDYGYIWEGMLPLRDRMAFYWHNFFQIYLLYPDGAETAANTLSDLHRHANDGGIFGIEVEDWEKKDEIDLKLSDKRSKEKSLIEIVMENLGVVESEKFNILLNDGERSMSNPFIFKDQTLEICIAALTQNIKALQFVEEQFLEQIALSKLVDIEHERKKN